MENQTETGRVRISNFEAASSRCPNPRRARRVALSTYPSRMRRNDDEHPTLIDENGDRHGHDETSSEELAHRFLIDRDTQFLERRDDVVDDRLLHASPKCVYVEPTKIAPVS